MKKMFSMVASLGALVVVGCSAGGADEPAATRADRIVLDVRCSADGDCPSGFECEQEHATSYCKSHESSPAAGNGSTGGAASTGACPAGFEQEIEHGGTFCKPHGGGRVDDAGTVPNTGSCTTDADCGAGLECEVEHGSSSCKPHRSRGGKGK